MNYEEKFKRLMKAHIEYKEETQIYISDLKRELSAVAEIIRATRGTLGHVSLEVKRLDMRMCNVHEHMHEGM